MGGFEFEAEEQPLPPPDGRSSVITKGKRTKRQRTLSTATSSSSICGGSGDYDFSPSSSSGTTVRGSTEEEVDMAYCLILLAQGPGRRRGEQVEAKLESGELLRRNERLSEAAAAAATRMAFYVYECKTCSRTFPSFQALGGHRASHKKPRVSEDAKKFLREPNSDEEEEGGQRQLRGITIGPSPQSKLLQASRPKIHECLICRAEFASGQALGGHMRRHRAAAAPSATSRLVTMSVDSMITDNRTDEHSSQGAVVSLDLNLPAPEDDRKFQFVEVPARKPLLFSGRALVDCYH